MAAEGARIVCMTALLFRKEPAESNLEDDRLSRRIVTCRIDEVCRAERSLAEGFVDMPENMECGLDLFNALPKGPVADSLAT